jgi:hypothetical protein
MKKFLLALLPLICILSTFSQSTYTGELAVTDPTFNRPDEGAPPTILSSNGTNVHYDVIPINVTTAGLITFECDAPNSFDEFCILYNTAGFDAVLPLNNALISNEDFIRESAGFSYEFTTPGVYYIVICSSQNDQTGGYNIYQSTTRVLPLQLLSFTVSKASSSANLVKWSSADESNLETYQVQRGADGKNFDDLKNGRTDAKNSATTVFYKFIDNNPGKGNNYYRLKITERSGTITYSPVAIVKNTGTGIDNVQLFPNPSSDYVRMEIKSMQNKNAFITVISSTGMIMQNGQYKFNDKAILSVDIRRLPPGKYFLKTTIGEEVSTTSFIKR